VQKRVISDNGNQLAQQYLRVIKDSAFGRGLHFYSCLWSAMTVEWLRPRDIAGIQINSFNTPPETTRGVNGEAVPMFKKVGKKLHLKEEMTVAEAEAWLEAEFEKLRRAGAFRPRRKCDISKNKDEHDE
jgi:hypothetical protein